MKHRNIARRYGATIAVAGTALVSNMAAAATSTYLDTGVSGAFSQYNTDISTLAGYAWPVVYTIVGILIAVSLFKKFANKVK